MHTRTGENLPTRFLRFFFYLIYQPLAWSYDLVAWVVSLGQWQAWIKSTLPYLTGTRVLELGHGPGHLQVAMRSKVVLGFGIDLSQQMGNLAVRKLRRAKFDPLLVRADGRHLPFATGSFDQIVATFPTEYILQPSTFGEAKRLLAQKGSLVLLPVAWIRGASVPSRLAAWLFRVTGQASEWDHQFTLPIRQAGFDIEENRIKLPGSEAMLLVCKPS